ncbi:MAG: sugar phosphate isomerase/epimerase [Cephaloticoccus sp.]|nr:sugar phosphate isomerase/epimerase [Cephaloticoccus sp.]
MISPGLVSVTFRKLAPADIVALVRQAGLHAIEWGGDVHVPHGDLGRAREVRELTHEAGLAVAAYGSYFRVAHSEDDGLPFQQVLATALELGAPIIRVWAGTTGSAEMAEDMRWRVVTDLRRIAELAAKVGVQITTEFHGGTLTDTNESASRLLVEVDHPNLYSYWQPLMGMSDDICLEGLHQLAPRLAHLHVYHWETTPQNRRPLAEGRERWQKFLTVAAGISGNRCAMLEFVEHDDPASFLRDAAVLQEMLKGLA